MNDYNRLARQAMRQALMLRKAQHISPNRPVQIYDLVDALGLELRFLDVPSMEGLYYRSNPAAIVISSLRPNGRRAYTCAHELGHHVFGHGNRIDELTNRQPGPTTFNAEEYVADQFASAMLMPKAAVDWAFHIRGWDPAGATPEQIYTIAGWLGVGYETLVYHLGLSLRLFGRTHMVRLLRVSPKRIRASSMGFEAEQDLLIADIHWQDRSIDIEAGDLVALPASVSVEGSCTEIVREDSDKTLVRGASPGCGRVAIRGGVWSADIRVARHGYVGRNMFRHLEESISGE